MHLIKHLQLFLFIIFLMNLTTYLSFGQTDQTTQNLQTPPQDDLELMFNKSEAWVDTLWKERYKDIFLKVGEIAPDFTLYTTDGKPFNFYEELEKGKPILLMTGSHSCPVARGNLKPINKFTKKYKKKLTAVMVYTIEAHPNNAVSPYSIKNNIWPDEESDIENPETYKERRQICDFWQNKYGLKPIVLVDNPTNDFWLRFGQAPNLAYLVKPDKTIFSYQIFINQNKLKEQINELLNEM